MVQRLPQRRNSLFISLFPVRAELAGHSLETTMKYGSPKREEIERAVAALDDAATV
jgi:hypothetical protein